MGKVVGRSIMCIDSIANLGSATRSASLALVFTIASQFCSTQQSELWSECVCWVVLPVAYMVHTRLSSASVSKRNRRPDTLQTTTSISLWVIPFSLGVTSFYKAEYGLIALYVSAVDATDLGLKTESR